MTAKGTDGVVLCAPPIRARGSALKSSEGSGEEQGGSALKSSEGSGEEQGVVH